MRRQKNKLKDEIDLIIEDILLREEIGGAKEKSCKSGAQPVNKLMLITYLFVIL